MEHFYKKIQGWFMYKKAYDIAINRAQDGYHFVEVGAWKGMSTSYMAVNIINSGKKVQFDVVDTWEGTPNEDNHTTDPAIINGTLYNEFLSNMEPVKEIVNPIRLTSREAVKLYEDNSLDFVMIDGSHEYEEVKHDITEWLKKVKPGGIIAGDDCTRFWPGVVQAVNELVPTAQFFEESDWNENNHHCTNVQWMYTKPHTFL